MIYKILLVKNRLRTKPNIKRYLDWFKLNTPIELVTEEITTDFDVTTKKAGNETYSGVICGDDILEKLRTVVPEHKYNCVVFMYGNELDGIRISAASGEPLYPDTDFVQTWRVTDNGKTINHELFHAFFCKAIRCGANLYDPMDTYIKNLIFTIDGVTDTNREMALKSLKPYWDIICAIDRKIIINRISDDGVQTLGTLVMGNFTCRTLERPWKNNIKNISCIPKGTYLCKHTFSPKFLKYTYELKNVPNRSGIRIHSGNFFFDIEGCILLGDGYRDINNDGKLDVVNSRITVKRFEELLGLKDFNLIIQ